MDGRGGDTEIAHVTPGEIVIPERLQTPEVLGALRMAALHQGTDPERLRIGSGRNSINPNTGQMEFDDDVQDGDETPIENVTVSTSRDPMDIYLDGRSLDELREMHGSLRRGISATQIGQGAATAATTLGGLLGGPIGAGPGFATTLGLGYTGYKLGQLQDHVNQRIQDIEDDERNR